MKPLTIENLVVFQALEKENISHFEALLAIHTFNPKKVWIFQDGVKFGFTLKCEIEKIFRTKPEVIYTLSEDPYSQVAINELIKKCKDRLFLFPKNMEQDLKEKAISSLKAKKLNLIGRIVSFEEKEKVFEINQEPVIKIKPFTGEPEKRHLIKLAKITKASLKEEWILDEKEGNKTNNTYEIPIISPANLGSLKIAIEDQKPSIFIEKSNDEILWQTLI